MATETYAEVSGRQLKFNWKPNRNFCVTTKAQVFFESPRAENRFAEFALEREGLVVVGYFKSKTSKELQDALDKCPHDRYAFLWDRTGKLVDGVY